MGPETRYASVTLLRVLSDLQVVAIATDLKLPFTLRDVKQLLVASQEARRTSEIFLISVFSTSLLDGDSARRLSLLTHRPMFLTGSLLTSSALVCCDDVDARVRKVAVRTISDDPGCPAASSKLQECLIDSDWGVQVAAIQELPRVVKQDDESAIRAVVELLRLPPSWDAEIPVLALRALLRIATQYSNVACVALGEASRTHPNKYVFQALRHLSVKGDRVAITRLIDCIDFVNDEGFAQGLLQGRGEIERAFCVDDLEAVLVALIDKVEPSLVDALVAKLPQHRDMTAPRSSKTLMIEEVISQIVSPCNTQVVSALLTLFERGTAVHVRASAAVILSRVTNKDDRVVIASFVKQLKDHELPLQVFEAIVEALPAVADCRDEDIIIPIIQRVMDAWVADADSESNRGLHIGMGGIVGSFQSLFGRGNQAVMSGVRSLLENSKTFDQCHFALHMLGSLSLKDDHGCIVEICRFFRNDKISMVTGQYLRDIAVGTLLSYIQPYLPNTCKFALEVAAGYLKDSEAQVRFSAANAMFQITIINDDVHNPDSRIVPALLDLTQLSDAGLRKTVMQTLRSFIEHKQVQQTFFAALHDEDAQIRAVAVFVCSSKGLRDSVVHSTLLSCLEDSSAEVRSSACEVVRYTAQQNGIWPESFIVALLEYLEVNQFENIDTKKQLLQDFPVTVGKASDSWSNNETKEAPHISVELLRNIINTLIKLVCIYDGTSIRPQALRALGSIANPETHRQIVLTEFLQILHEELQEEDDTIAVLNYIVRFAHRGDWDVISSVASCLDHPAYFVRQAAVVALREIVVQVDENLTELVIEMVEDEVGHLRECAFDLLEHLAMQQDAMALSAIGRMKESPDFAVRNRARSFLPKLDDSSISVVNNFATRPPTIQTREALVLGIFKALDPDDTGRLGSAALRKFAMFNGFDGTDEDWDEEFEILCGDWECETSQGVSEAVFTQLVNDNSHKGCFCDDRELAVVHGRLCLQVQPLNPFLDRAFAS